MSTSEVESLKLQVSELKKELNSVDKKVDRILFHLNNDPETDHIGLMGRIQRSEMNCLILTKDIVSINELLTIDKEVKKRMLLFYGSIISVIAGAFYWLAKFIFTYIASKII